MNAPCRFPSPYLEVEDEIGAAVVCFVMLYGLDAVCFDGRYFAAIEHVLHDIYAHW
jgi:hypothetical protein